MGEPRKLRREQAREILDGLDAEYLNSAISLKFDSRLQLLSLIVLSVNCTGERVDEVTVDLFETDSNAEQFSATGDEALSRGHVLHS